MLKHLQWSIPSILFLIFLVSGKPSPDHTPSIYTSAFENVLGTSFDLKVWALEESQADHAEQVALDEIDRLSAILSSYDTDSEFSIWSRTLNTDVKISPELMEVLSLFDEWRIKTDGALNPAAGVILNAWRKAASEQHLPARSILDESVTNAAQQHWSLDKANGTARHLTATPLVMNSFVKSYIIRKVADKVLGIPGISSVVVNIGGDLCIKGSEAEEISIVSPLSDNADPLSRVLVRERAVATSGSYKRGYSINGSWYSHIIDARTGEPAGHITSATVVAPSAEVAGALATAFNIMDVNTSQQLASEIGNVEYLIVTKDGKRIVSDGWEKIAVEKIKVPVKASNIQKPWHAGYEVDVHLELARFEGRARRPFVAIWVEDSKKKTVRTLALWFNKARWLPDLKEWFRKNSDVYHNGPKDVFSIGSATRPAGTYTIKWDGKNDDGAFVSEGSYTVYIEVAREHGTYQLMKQELICKDKVQQFKLQPNVEVVSASVDYKKASN